MKYIRLNAMFLMFVFLTSCGKSQTDAPEAYVKSEFKDTVTSYGPNTMVRNVRQAKNGDILIAAYNGVFRYDGKSFTNITSRIPSPSFWDVLEDRKGNLWFGTRDSGIYRFNGKSFQHFTTKQGLVSNYGAIHLYEDKSGNIWFGTVRGAYRYDARLNDGVGQGKSLRKFTTKDGLPSNDINTIMEDKTGKLWFGTRGDLSVYDGKTFTVLKNEDGKTFTNVWGITEDRKGNIWFGANGLWRYDGSTYTKVSQKGAYAIIEDKKGNIWTTGADEPPRIGQVWSLSRYDQKSLYDKMPAVTVIKSGGPAFLGLLEANNGSIWFGALDGVHRYDARLPARAGTDDNDEVGKGKTFTDFKSAAGQ